MNGGLDPVWRDGELLFDDRERLIQAVPVTTTASNFSMGRATALFKIPTRGGGGTTAFEVSPDGHRFLVRVPIPMAPQPLSIILNWTAKLSARQHPS